MKIDVLLPFMDSLCRVRNKIMHVRTLVANCLGAHSIVILVFISLTAAQLGK